MYWPPHQLAVLPLPRGFSLQERTAKQLTRSATSKERQTSASAAAS
jgi:hypothetical protein